MHSKTSARAVGALFLTATVSGVLSAVLLGPLDTLTNTTRISAGALMVVVMAAAIALISTTLFPVLKQHSEVLALSYVASRIVECVLLLPAAIVPLMLVAVDPSHLDTVRALSRAQGMGVYASSSIFFCLSALLLNFLLYRTTLVPRWISGWALIAVVPYLADACLVMFGELTTSSTVHSIMVAPLALNEMVLAVWLLTKGFRVPSDSQRFPSRTV
jgi:hypothetical protein